MVCSYCGREVRPTVHRRESDSPWSVDYYRMLTGKPVRMTMQSPREDEEVKEFYKLIEIRWVVCCVDCLHKPEVANELARLFAELPAKEEAETEGT